MRGDFGSNASSPCFPLQPASPHRVSHHSQHSHHHHQGVFAGCGGTSPRQGGGLRLGGGPPALGLPLPLSAPDVQAHARPHALPSPSFATARERRLASRDSANSRKRKPLFSEDEDESMCGDGSSASPNSEKAVSPIPAADSSLHGTKRTKFDDQRQIPLRRLLDTLDKPQLLDLIVSMTEQFPPLKEYVNSHIPRPTLQGVEALLLQLERKLRDSFPFTKWGPSRDDYAFNRVKPVLLEIKDTVLIFCHHFTGPDEFPAVAFPFLYEATSVALRLPEWDKAQNNAIKFDLVSSLLESYRLTVLGTAAKCSGGKLFGMQVVDDWARGILDLLEAFPRSTGCKAGSDAAASGEAVGVSTAGIEREACWRALLKVARDFGDKLGWMCPPHTLQQFHQIAGTEASGG